MHYRNPGGHYARMFSKGFFWYSLSVNEWYRCSQILRYLSTCTQRTSKYFRLRLNAEESSQTWYRPSQSFRQVRTEQIDKRMQITLRLLELLMELKISTNLLILASNMNRYVPCPQKVFHSGLTPEGHQILLSRTDTSHPRQKRPRSTFLWCCFPSILIYLFVLWCK